MEEILLSHKILLERYDQKHTMKTQNSRYYLSEMSLLWAYFDTLYEKLICKDLSDGGFHPTEKVEIPNFFHLEGRTTNRLIFKFPTYKPYYLRISLDKIIPI